MPLPQCLEIHLCPKTLYTSNFKHKVNMSLKLVIIAQNGICKFDFKKNKLSSKYSTSMANPFCVELLHSSKSCKIIPQKGRNLLFCIA